MRTFFADNHMSTKINKVWWYLYINKSKNIFFEAKDKKTGKT